MGRVLVAGREVTLVEEVHRALRGRDVEVQVVGDASALAAAMQSPPAVLVADSERAEALVAPALSAVAALPERVPIVFVGRQPIVAAGVRWVPSSAPLSALAEALVSHLGAAESVLPPAPFGAFDYLQLASAGQHSVVLTLRAEGATRGRVVVVRGVLWAAEDSLGTGVAAFRRIAQTDGLLRCGTFHGDPGPRQIEESWEALLLDAVREKDEQSAERPLGSWLAHADTAAEFTPTLQLPKPPPLPTPDSYEEAFDEGIAALLKHDHVLAFRCFRRALELRPGDALAAANLARLTALGHGPP